MLVGGCSRFLFIYWSRFTLYVSSLEEEEEEDDDVEEEEFDIEEANNGSEAPASEPSEPEMNFELGQQQEETIAKQTESLKGD